MTPKERKERIQMSETNDVNAVVRCEPATNDEVRELLASKNITTDNVTMKQLMELHDILSEKLENSDCFRGSYRMDGLYTDDRSKFMTCSADYFEGREAISFNRDGFIGMAGWASSKNVQPIRDAVVEWANSYT